MIDLENGRRYLNQWELDQRVQVDNFLPGTWVEFYNRNDCKSGTQITEAYEENGHVFADIPNAFLQTHGYLHVCVNPFATDTAHQPEEKDIKIVRKEKPENYTYTETPVISYAALEARIRRMELGGGAINGIPPGGKTGQYLRKLSDKDFDVAWADLEIPEQYGLVSYDQDKTITIT